MSGWAKALPRVTVPRTAVATPMTVIVPYYENPQFLQRQLQHWATWAAAPDLGPHVTVIVVDDGSPSTPARHVAEPLPAFLRLFEIQEDRPWNWLAARNIGFAQAADGWCLVTDMDHVVPEATLRAVLYGRHDPSVIYGFSRMDIRVDEGSAQPVAPHPNSWLLTREMFWRVGGYDETLSGHYGTDGDWRRRCAQVAPIQILTDTLLRYEHHGDSSTTRYRRKSPEDVAAVQRLVAARQVGWAPKTLSFPYLEVGR